MSADDSLIHCLMLLAVVIAAVVPFCWALRREKKRMLWKELNCCQKCGYDLRGSSGRCPECGHNADDELPMVFPLNVKTLTHDWPDEALQPRTPAADEVPVHLYQSESSADAGLIVEQLEARGIVARFEEGIPIRLRSEKSYTNVFVWSDDLERARAIVKLFRVKTAAKAARETKNRINNY